VELPTLPRQPLRLQPLVVEVRVLARARMAQLELPIQLPVLLDAVEQHRHRSTALWLHLLVCRALAYPSLGGGGRHSFVTLLLSGVQVMAVDAHALMAIATPSPLSLLL
jgi:hypothetical protein